MTMQTEGSVLLKDLSHFPLSYKQLTYLTHPEQASWQAPIQDTSCLFLPMLGTNCDLEVLKCGGSCLRGKALSLMTSMWKLHYN